MDTPPALGAVTLWDLPVRLVHWSFVILLPALWWTAETGRMDVHQWLGHVLLFLLVFRIFWGFAGSGTARFSGFLKGPRAALAYARTLRGGRGVPVVGHNPLGGWSAIAMLGLMLLQVSLGLVAQDTDGLVSGPLAHYVSYETSDQARDWHESVFYLLLGLVALHVAAILFYLIVKRDDLVTPMVTGRRTFPARVEAPAAAARWRAALGALLAASLALWVWLGAPL